MRYEKTSLTYPKGTTYLQALQKNTECLLISDLSGARVFPGGPVGLPLFYHGAFAIVVPLKVGDKTKAARMYTMHIDDAEENYRIIRDYLQRTRLPYFVDFNYYAEGIVLQKENEPAIHYPVLTMDWLEGKTLKPFIKENLHDKRCLLELANAWREMMLCLHKKQIAHGDLQEANIFVQQVDSKPSLRLLDYDSLVVPSLVGKKESVLGVPAYQHPFRKQCSTKSLHVDTFSAFLIDFSLRVLAQYPNLWNDWSVDNDSAWLFEAEDYQNALDSEKIQHLMTLSDDIKKMAEKLVCLCQKSKFADIPSISELWPPQPWYQQPKPTLRTEHPWYALNPIATEPKSQQEKKAKFAAGQSKSFCVGKVDFVMRWIPAGRFVMGSSVLKGDTDGRPQHNVIITKGFWLSETPVTQHQYKAIMKKNPSHFKDAGLHAPVENVSWYDAMGLANKLSELEGLTKCSIHADIYTNHKGWRLPTEAEWEYAYGAGSDSSFYNGENEDCVDEIAWFEKNSGKTTHPVKKKQSNSWGLCDMAGNVWEWCYDWYGAYTAQEVTDPVGVLSGTTRVQRGGSWLNYARFVRAAVRRNSDPCKGERIIGFRLVRSGD